MESINLGTFDKGVAEYIINVFKEKRNEYKERDPNRIKCHILQRGRGQRNLWKMNKEKVFEKITGYSPQQDIPVKYAQRVALYLKINETDKDKIDKAIGYTDFIKSVKITHEDSNLMNVIKKTFSYFMDKREKGFVNSEEVEPIEQMLLESILQDKG